jgi:hypothetical protein
MEFTEGDEPKRGLSSMYASRFNNGLRLGEFKKILCNEPQGYQDQPSRQRDVRFYR